MSNTGQLNQTGAKTFQKESKLGQILPIGFLTFGVGTMGIAVLTAMTPAPAAFVSKLAGVLDQVGLDKGPLLMFGVLSTAMGFALSRLEKSSRGGSASLDAANFAQANASSIELQGEILGSVQAELGTIRHELSTARQEAKEEKEAGNDGNGEASDPIFRLAASLDQLGAQIDKRIDKARREMIDAVSGVAGTVEVSASQREEAFKESASNMDAIRMDIADLRAQLTRVATDVSSAKSSIADLNVPSAAAAQPVAAAAEPTPAEAPSPAPVAAAEVAPVAAPKPAALPVELTDAAESSESSESTTPSEAAPASSTQEPGAEEPQFEGFQFEKDAEEGADAAPQVLDVNMKSLGFPEPPAPMPKPSEDLGLIDQMQQDTANKGDETPPLFPDAFDQN